MPGLLQPPRCAEEVRPSAQSRWQRLQLEEGRSGSTFEVSLDRLQDEVEGRASFQRAGRHDRPNSLAPLSAPLAARALRNQAIDHYKANGLFGDVVRRVDSWRRYELEVGLTVIS